MAVLVRCSGCGLSLDVSRQPPGSVLSCRCGERLEVPRGDVAAGMLRCPNCGAPAKAGSRECNHCHAGLKTLRCPSCFSFGFVGNHHCARCGGSLASIPANEALEIDCPRCRVKLQGQTFDEVPIASCERCGGTWLDHKTFRKVKVDARRRAVMAFQERPVPPPPQPPGASIYVPCPVCRNIMNRVNFARRSGVIVDICRNHGMWCDADELTAIIHFIDSGGLERATALEAQLKAEEMRSLKLSAALNSAGAESPWGNAPASRGSPAAKLVLSTISWVWRTMTS